MYAVCLFVNYQIVAVMSIDVWAFYFIPLVCFMLQCHIAFNTITLKYTSKLRIAVSQCFSYDSGLLWLSGVFSCFIGILGLFYFCEEFFECVDED